LIPPALLARVAVDRMPPESLGTHSAFVLVERGGNCSEAWEWPRTRRPERLFRPTSLP